MSLIENIKWHDLPIKNISLIEDRIRLEVLQFNDESQEYDGYVLELFEFESVDLSINGQLASRTLDEMDVSHFDYTLDDDLLSGCIQILPGNGYWEIKIQNSKWSLCEST
ncbi:hypothetical protein MIB92_19395 [Aestuariirhabdus sp. Z084]|uniref:hypothetical protein n=1 Tax=Aestuariirhabdus haliotis TaxID=2918751 RepID=UPI00201B45A9|nr:hypothetical protein [Aestuariirhabdus haliotis]MCL6417823.1 hypothetical protein [Aestuariirhabdus haliotis]MCL6421736.1 hypothetical protein [Aestuariirhabdus haliotis]